MRAAEDPANPLCEFVGAQQTVGLDHFALAMNPFWLYGVQPRALLRKKAAYDPYPAPAVLDFSVVSSEPASDLFGEVPTRVVPDEYHDFLADLFEPLGAPRQKLSRYPTDGPTIHKPQPCLVELRQIEPIAGDGLRVGIILGDRLLNEAQGLSLLGEATQGGQGQPTPPALVFEAHCPLRIRLGYLHQSIAPSFFLSYRGSGEVIQRLARCQRTPRTRTRVARMVSPREAFLRDLPQRRPVLPSVVSTDSYPCQTPPGSGVATPATAQRCAHRRLRGFFWDVMSQH